MKLNKARDVLHSMLRCAYVELHRSSSILTPFVPPWHDDVGTKTHLTKKFLSLSLFHSSPDYEPRWKSSKTRTGERYDRRSL